MTYLNVYFSLAYLNELYMGSFAPVDFIDEFSNTLVSISMSEGISLA